VILNNSDSNSNSNSDLGEAGARDKAKGASGDINTRHVKGDASPLKTSIILELILRIEFINISGLWYDIKEGRYIKELVPGPMPSILV
jgi:hypothetical protein